MLSHAKPNTASAHGVISGKYQEVILGVMRALVTLPPPRRKHSPYAGKQASK